MNHFFVFGSHPRLSLAELHAVRSDLPAPALFGPAAIVDATHWNGEELMRRLGGTVKLGNIVGEMPTANVSGDAVAELMEDRLGKKSIDFGWTVYGGNRNASARMEKMALSCKKALKARGVSSRWVTGKDGTISPAAIAKLKLTTEGLDVCVFIDGDRTHIGLTTNVQDADAWSLRDFGRPARDEVVGMLPPKLARMMVNLAGVPSNGILFDPFCGGGTVSMEAALATDASKIIASDIDARQVSNAKRNSDWLVEKTILNKTDAKRFDIFQSDVRALTLKPNSVDRVVTEGSLGPPLTGQETKATLDRNVKQISDLWRDALQVLHPLLKKDGRVVCVWPAFKTSHGIARVDLADRLKGFSIVNPLAGWDDSDAPLLYMRAEQRVMRRIVVLKKIT